MSIALADANSKYSFKLVKRENVTHNTIWLRFELPANQSLGVKPGYHVLVLGQVDDDVIMRPYSPVSIETEKGFFDLVIKVYKPNQEFSEGGKLSQFLDAVKVGDKVDFKGPVGKYNYESRGLFNFGIGDKTVEKKFKQVGLITGGSGVTPLLAIAKTICNDPEDKTKVSMIFSNYTEEDILLRKELDTLAKSHPNKFKIWYTLTRGAKPGWAYSQGRINEDMVKKHLPAPSDDTLILVCGPKDMYETMYTMLFKVGYAKDSVDPAIRSVFFFRICKKFCHKIQKIIHLACCYKHLLI